MSTPLSYPMTINVTLYIIYDMEKFFNIILELCAIIMAAQMVYHFFNTESNAILLFFAGMFAVIAFILHSHNRKLKFKS